MDTSPFDTAAALMPAHPGLTECLQCQGVGLVTVLATLAAHVALGPGHRVVSVRLSHDASRSAWSSEGRREHFQSHKLR